MIEVPKFDAVLAVGVLSVINAADVAAGVPEAKPAPFSDIPLSMKSKEIVQPPLLKLLVVCGQLTQPLPSSDKNWDCDMELSLANVLPLPLAVAAPPVPAVVVV